MSDVIKEKNINFKIDEDTHKKLRHLALDQSQTLKDFVKTALTQLVNKETGNENAY